MNEEATFEIKKSNHHLVKGGLKAGHGGLSTAVDLVARDPPEVGTPGDGVGQLLDLFEVISHDCWVCHLDVSL